MGELEVSKHINDLSKHKTGRDGSEPISVVPQAMLYHKRCKQIVKVLSFDIIINPTRPCFLLNETRVFRSVRKKKFLVVPDSRVDLCL